MVAPRCLAPPVVEPAAVEPADIAPPPRGAQTKQPRLNRSPAFSSQKCPPFQAQAAISAKQRTPPTKDLGTPSHSDREIDSGRRSSRYRYLAYRGSLGSEFWVPSCVRSSQTSRKMSFSERRPLTLQSQFL